MTYIHAPVNVILPRSNGITVELGNPERVVPIPSGAQGLPGEPGFSPVVSVEPITGGNRVTITDADGDTTFDVMNGAQGEQGEPGEGVPAGGAQGQVLKKASNADYDTEWANESGSVTSVNGQTGDVVLSIPTKTSDLTNDSGFITDAGVTSFNGQTGAVTYAAPVQSVNGATGAVVLDADDVGAMSKWTLLWTNASPSSAFAAQTISLDLSGYDMVMVVYQHWTSADVNNSAFCRIGNYGRLLSHDYTLAYRDYHPETTGIYFNTGLVVGTYNNSSVNNNTSAVIPIQIYGIKGVQ